MSNSGPGADRHGSSSWDSPSWSSSLSDSSLSRGDEQPPNPWSREATSPTDGLPSSAPSADPEPADPHPPPTSAPPPPAAATYPGPFPAAAPGRPEPPPPGFDPQPIPPYGAGASGASSYGSPAAAYGDPTAGYAAPPPPYGSNPYEVPYAPAYGTSVPYGMPAPSHPSSSSALIFGILGIVFGFSCGIGGLIGIPGIVQGRRARREIDAQPGRYGGRSQAVAGIVTGTIGVVVAALTVVVVLIIVVASLASGGS